MTKIKYIILAVLIFMVGCVNFENGVLMDEQDPVSEEDLTINDMRILDLVGLNKDELLFQLGKEYVFIYGWADQEEREGYEYSKQGIELYFNEEKIIEIIYCDEKANISGVRMGMNFSEIQHILGKGEINNFGDNIVLQYVLQYKYKNFVLCFGSRTEQGSSEDLYIKFNV